MLMKKVVVSFRVVLLFLHVSLAYFDLYMVYMQQNTEGIHLPLSTC